jgi:hypothetical protein
MHPFFGGTQWQREVQTIGYVFADTTGQKFGEG